MRKLFGITLIVAGLFLGTYVFYPDIIKLRFYSDETIQKRFKPLTSKYGIKIVYEIGPDYFASLGSEKARYGASKEDSTAKRISNFDLLRCPNLLEKAFGRYPVRFIKKHLSAIHLAGEIINQGSKCSGTYDPYRKVVFLVRNNFSNDQNFVGTFHHEFSSMLLNDYTLLRLSPWLNNNPERFDYFYNIYNGDEIFGNSEKGIEQKVHLSLEGTETDYEMGFMNTYGQTNFENDFNTYAEMIFSYPEKFKAIMEKHPRVKGKFKVFQKFYEEIDPIFTEEYLLNSKSEILPKTGASAIKRWKQKGWGTLLVRLGKVV